MVLVIVEAIILLVLSVLKSVYQIYAALAIGQLANKHRILLSLGAYIGISMIMSILFLLIVAASDSVGTISCCRCSSPITTVIRSPSVRWP